MNGKKLRAMFMDEAAEKLLKQYVDVIQHKDTFHSTDIKAREEMWSILKHAILSTKDADKQEFETTKDILNLVKSGKISPQEGKEYLMLMGIQNEIDESQDNSSKSTQIGLSFYVEDEDDENEVKETPASDMNSRPSSGLVWEEVPLKI